MSDDIKLIHTNFYVYIFYDHRKSGKIYNLLNDFPVTFEHEPFYVGISQRNNRIEVHINDAIRLYKKDEKIINKYSNPHKIRKIHQLFQYEGWFPIIKYKENLTEQEAKDLEIKLIATIGRSDLKLGPLTNMTNGGNGTFGYKHTEETKKKQRNSKLGKYDGKNNPNYGNGDKIRGDRNPAKQEVSRIKISNAIKGTIRTDEEKEKNRQSHLGKKASSEAINKMIESRIGKPSGMKGKHHSEETKKKMRESHKKLNIIK